VKDLFQAASDLQPEEREAYLEAACPDDPELLAEVRRLLEVGSSDDLKRVERALAESREPPTDGPQPGERIGAYTIVRAIGEGGMGLVFEATQTDPIRRRVALKIIKPGMDSRHVLARFESERQALALLNHAHIAKVLDAGTAESGRPFFVMEHVQGEPITDWCDGRRLDVRDRLALLAGVCDGVQHAHQKGILHRDLKPSNILVAEDEGEPCPKIIDFGVAKALGESLTDLTLQTRIDQVVGTPAYMSPEQAEGSGVDVDSRTDVYSLGIVMYELLVGRSPFDAREIQRGTREEPRRASARLASLSKEHSTDVAARRNTDPRALWRSLRGDLDWIVKKALETDRDRRYGSASDLATDIRRYLDHQPVLAGPPSPGYRASKFAQRHRLGVAMAALLVVAMLVGAIGITIGLFRARRAERQAKREALTATRASEFLVSLFDLSDLRVSSRADTTALELLDRGAASIDAELADAPIVQARLKYSMGRAYVGIGRVDDAKQQLETALDIQRRVLGEVHLATLRTKHELAFVYWAWGPVDEGVRLFEDALKSRRRVLGADHPDTLIVAGDLANAYLRQGRFDEAEAIHLEVLETQRRLLGDDHPDTVLTINYLGNIYRKRGSPELAEPLFREGLDLARRVFGEDHFQTTTIKMGLANALRDQGHLGEDVERLYLDIIESYRRRFGPENKPIQKARMRLAVFYHLRGELEKAEPLARGTADAWRRDQRADHPDTLLAIHILGVICADLGRHDEAEALLGEALDGRLGVLGADN